MPHKPMVVHLARLYAPHLGGVEKHLFELTTIQKFSSYIITEQFSETLPLVEKRTEATLIRIPIKGASHKLAIWRGIAHSLDLLQSADIIHIHDVFWWLLPFLPFLNRKNIYITFHGYEGDTAPNFKQIFWHKIADWYAQGNICIGDFHKKWYKVQPTFVSYGAVKKNFIEKKQPTKNKVTKIIFAGRLSKDTGITDYIQAIKIMYETDKTIQLDIFGDGPLKNEVVAYVSKHKLPICFFGWVAPDAISWQKYQYAFVSRYLSILEALSAHLPVVAHANNKIKYDYLALSPFATWIVIATTPQEIVDGFKKSNVLPQAALKWVNSQTWEKLSNLYKKLWDISSN